MAASSQPNFRIDVAINELLVRPSGSPPGPPEPRGATLPEPVFPQYPELLADPGPEVPPDRREWSRGQLLRKARGWLVPYLRSRLQPGLFHPITAYLFVEYRCNIDCWYCWSYNNKTEGMTEDVARRAIDWLHDHGCRVLAFMGGEPLLRPHFAHKIVYYAAKKGFWIYIGTNGRVLRPEVADRLGDAGAAVFNIALDAWDPKPGLPKALTPVRKNLEHLMRKQYVYGYMVFLNINICRNNLEDVRRLTEFAREHKLATDYHLNETPMLEQDEHFRHLEHNPTYIRFEDWREVDGLIDWLIEKNRAGYQMVNSAARLREMKAFMRMASGLDLRQVGWYGDGTGAGDALLASMPGIATDANGGLRFVDWNCRAGHNNVIIRTDGTIGPCFPMYEAAYDWGTIEGHGFDARQLARMKRACQKHCFSTLNHNLSYCYDGTRALKWLWRQARNGFRGGARSFED
jgi:MoaA/NifB/PqqE/SkfB family radical SAM enzyme